MMTSCWYKEARGTGQATRSVEFCLSADVTHPHPTFDRVHSVRVVEQALMTDRQKRVMLKLFAVSAFLNHRDFRDSSAASVLRLRDETDRIFSQPLTADSRASLKTVCMQVRREPYHRASGGIEMQEQGHTRAGEEEPCRRAKLVSS